MKHVVWDEPTRVMAFVARILEIPPSRDGAAIGLKDAYGNLIAGVLFDNYNGASIQMHVAAEPGARWMTREYLHCCFAYPFRQLAVRKIVGLVSCTNLPARRFDEHLGFHLEATLTDAHPDGDLLVYTMTKQQCRWLSIPLRNPAHGKELTSAAT